MENLGTKNTNMYPSMESNEKDKVNYRTITLPMAILGGKEVEIGDEVTFTIKGEVKMKMEMEGMADLSIELCEGKLVSKKAETESDDKTLLG